MFLEDTERKSDHVNCRELKKKQKNCEGHGQILGCHLLILFLRELILMLMMNCCCGMVDQQNYSTITSWDHCQRSSLSRISDMPRAGFEPAQNLISGFVE